MSGLKELRTRIGTTKTIRQVTSAMKMVSAAKLKRAQDTVIHFRPYTRNFENMMNSIIAGSDNLNELVYTAPRNPDKVLVVLISSNRGLCGGFNSSVTKSAIELVHSKYKKQYKNKNVSFLAIGKQGEILLKSHKFKVIGNKNDLFDQLNFNNTSALASQIINDYCQGTYDRVELVYNEFINAAQYQQRRETFLPIQFDQNKTVTGDAIFEPSKLEILDEMVPLALKTLFYKAMIYSYAAEHGARMTAMHQATDNATELLGDLSLQYNKARQATITNEILEITAGAEAQRK